MFCRKIDFVLAARSLVVVLFLFGWVSNSMSQEFRIETEVYAGDGRSPVAQNLTLFSDQMIYDFQMSNDPKPIPVEIVIYDLREKSFALIDTGRNVSLKLDQSQLSEMLEGAKQQTRQNPKTKFLLDPLKEKMDVAGEWMTVANKNISYRFQGKRPADVSILPTYFEFLDEYTRLKASDPRSLPPFARLQLNLSIKKLGWIPTTIEAKYKVNDLIKNEINMRSKHTFIAQLSKQDQIRIDSAKATLMGATPVNLPTFRGLTPPTATASSNITLKR